MSIRLSELARAVRFERRTLERWADTGILRGTNLGRGRNRGIFLSRDQAIEAFAVVLLRRAGVPMQRLGPEVLRWRRQGKHGRDFLAAGAAGRNVLLDGDGAAFPLRDPKTGQGFLPMFPDLRTISPEILRAVTELEKKEAARSTRATD